MSRGALSAQVLGTPDYIVDWAWGLDIYIPHLPRPHIMRLPLVGDT